MAVERSGIAIGLRRGHVSLHFPCCIKHNYLVGDEDKTFQLEEGSLTVHECQQKTTPHEIKSRISRTKGHLSKRTAFVREVVKEVAGYVLPTITLHISEKEKKKDHEGSDMGYLSLGPEQNRS